MSTVAIQPVDQRTASAPEPTPIVRVRGLCKDYDDRPVLQDVNFEFGAGSIVALLGANGAGKSTLMKILAMLTPPSSGELCLFGQPAHAANAALRARLGMIGHGAMLYRELTPLENLVFFGRLYGVDNVQQRAEEMLQRVSLLHRAHDQVKTLSRGMLQRVSIARALMHNPDLLLADEPFTGLDAPSRSTLETLLIGIRDQGKSIILANHDVAQSLMIADMAIVLHHGTPVLVGSTRDIELDQVFQAVSGS